MVRSSTRGLDEDKADALGSSCSSFSEPASLNRLASD